MVWEHPLGAPSGGYNTCALGSGARWQSCGLGKTDRQLTASSAQCSGEMYRELPVCTAGTRLTGMCPLSLVSRGPPSTKDSRPGDPLPWALLCQGHGRHGLKDGRAHGGDTSASPFARVTQAHMYTGMQHSRLIRSLVLTLYLATQDTQKNDDEATSGRLFYWILFCISLQPFYKLGN